MALVFPYLIFLLLLLLQLSSAQTYQNVSVGTSLSTNNENPYWISPSGEFAFGFYPVKDKDVFLLAIWYKKITIESIIWTANQGSPVERGSKVELTPGGVLSLSTPNGTISLIAESSDTIMVTSAAMLDTGNFVLSSEEGDIKWSTFEQPTDTILPTQTLNPTGNQLYARLTDNDYVTGRFGFWVGDVDIALFQMDQLYGKEKNYGNYWVLKADVSQLVFNKSGHIYITQKNSSSSSMNLSSNPRVLSPTEFYHRATLDFDGVFRHYTYPKTLTDKAWSITEYVPENICEAFGGSGSTFGSGACGFNSYCTLDDNTRPKCHCPPMYSFKDLNNIFKGCQPDFLAQTCGTSDGFEMREIKNSNWPMSDYQAFPIVSEEWCRETCLADCFCAAAISGQTACWLKRFPLSNGWSNQSINAKTLIKVGSQSQTVLPPTSNSVKKNRDDLILPVSIVLCGSVLINFLLVLAMICVRRRILQKKKGSRNKMQRRRYQDLGTSGMNLQSFTYEELEEATDGFKEQLGKGASSTVYKGFVESNKLVAVKRLELVVEGVEKEFKAEINAIGRTNHKNLVQLLGFCDEGAHRLLVYEFMNNGSLASILFEGSRPDWYQRIQIVFGIARGIVYLHEECSTQIIHCDIKPQNILLDDYFNVKISDFGLAKLLKSDQSQTNTGVRGTRGYVAPEWFRNLPITTKVDVYSFGVMLLEIICCRKNYENEDTDILSDWAYDCCVERTLHLLVENDEEAKSDGVTLERFVMSAIWCIREDPAHRPSMKKVIQMLEGAIQIGMPQDLQSFGSLIDT